MPIRITTRSCGGILAFLLCWSCSGASEQQLAETAEGKAGTVAARSLGGDGAAPAREQSRSGTSPENRQGQVLGVRLEHVVTVSDPQQRSMLSSPLVVTPAGGRFLVLSPAMDGVLSYDPSGKFQSRVGRRGRMDGEFQRGSRILVRPDGGVLIYDLALGRLTLFDADLRLQRVIPFPYAPDFILPNGDFVVAQQIRSPDLIGHPVHRVASNGVVASSFGMDTPQYRPDLALTVNRLVAPGGQGTVWTVAPGRYVLERWDPMTGERLARLAVQSTWFQESTHRRGDERVRPSAIIEAIWEQDALVWIQFRDADSDWRPPPDANKERPHDAAEYNRTYDWVLEAVDPTTGSIVASKRFDDLLSASGSRPLIATAADNVAVSLSYARVDPKGASK